MAKSRGRTKLKYKPGVLMGGRYHVHDCGLSRSIGYFLEPLIVLGLFGKKPLSIRLKGIANDSKDPSVDTFRSTTLNILKRFGAPSEGLELKMWWRSYFECSNDSQQLSSECPAVTWIDEGMVKRIRGVTFSTRASSQFENTMIHAARGIFNRLLPDVHIFTDHKSREQAGKSLGFGISLVAETTSGCFISTDTAVCYARGEDADDNGEKKELMAPEDIGEQTASMLLGEIE
ncbi:RNA 3'-terminal phosphate cyclase [Macleaya cordata]|uniref:RNA 3'-terminal phosphate cyclase n=1 Tax=Macleaya cordata TaxID=56857 RepID=A0A200R8P4_MACCD|nr:RNA 3'-terminal phosphate cyclase [Macleaya cordata]